MNTEKITRFEVVDEKGRSYVKYGVSIELSFQDNNRTLKVFVTEKPKKIDPNQVTLDDVLEGKLTPEQIEVITGTDKLIKKGLSGKV